MIKEAGACGAFTPLSLPQPQLRTTRASLVLTPSRPHNFRPSRLDAFFFFFFMTSCSLPPSALLHSCLFRKPQHEQRKDQEPKKPHIKKPLNAFMLYMKEMRANVVAECTLKESAAINQILGRRVGSILCVAVVSPCRSEERAQRQQWLKRAWLTPISSGKAHESSLLTYALVMY